MTKRKADCTPEEWARELKRSREKSRKMRQDPQKRAEHNKRARERLSADPSARKRYNKQKREAARVRREQDPDYREKHNTSARLARYGISRVEFDALRKAQNDTCAVCGSSLDVGMHVDHCHDTGKVRGLLCRRCNVAEGQIRATGIGARAFGERLQHYLDNPPASGADLV